MIRGGNVTECKENSVAGVVVLGIKIPQRLVGQIGNHLGIAPTVEVVGVGRE